MSTAALLTWFLGIQALLAVVMLKLALRALAHIARERNFYLLPEE